MFTSMLSDLGDGGFEVVWCGVPNYLEGSLPRSQGFPAGASPASIISLILCLVPAWARSLSSPV